MPDLDRQIEDGPLLPLTPQQREIALLLGQGKSYVEVGEALGLSPRTIEKYVADAAMRFANPYGFEPHVVLIVYAVRRAALEAKQQPSA